MADCTCGSALVERASAKRSGREFFAVYSYRAGNLMPLSILACNPDPIVPPTVTVETELAVVGGGTVPPGGCEIVLVSNERKASATIEERLAYRVSSDRPILVQQYADYAVQSGYPSAARLPDTAELGTEYMVLAMRAGTRDTEPSVVTVVAPRPARGSVTVTADTQAAGITPALAAGATYTTDLPAFGVLQLASVPDGDLTGNIVRSDVPVQVLGGCITCFVSISATADGMQEVMPPLATWGRRYVVPASYPTTMAPNLIRIDLGSHGVGVWRGRNAGSRWTSRGDPDGAVERLLPAVGGELRWRRRDRGRSVTERLPAVGLGAVFRRASRSSTCGPWHGSLRRRCPARCRSARACRE